MYAGLASGIFGVASTNFAYFYWYSWIRRKMLARLTRRGLTADDFGTVMELVMGAMAGALAQIFTIPVSVVTTRLQTQVIVPSSAEIDDDENRSLSELPEVVQDGAVRMSNTLWMAQRKPSVPTFCDAVLQIIREDGWTGLWRGLGPSLVLTVNPALTYGLFERVKVLWLHSRQHSPARLASSPSAGPICLSTLEIFSLGVMSKIVATVITYPYIMAKVRMQWKPVDHELNAKVSPASRPVDI